MKAFVMQFMKEYLERLPLVSKDSRWISRTSKRELQLNTTPIVQATQSIASIRSVLPTIFPHLCGPRISVVHTFYTVFGCETTYFLPDLVGRDSEIPTSLSARARAYFRAVRVGFVRRMPPQSLPFQSVPICDYQYTLLSTVSSQ